MPHLRHVRYSQKRMRGGDRRRVVAACCTVLLACVGADTLPRQTAAAETATLADGRRVRGHLELVDGRPMFRCERPQRTFIGGDLRHVAFEAAEPNFTPDAALRNILLWSGERVFGTVTAIAGDTATLEVLGRRTRAPLAAISGIVADGAALEVAVDRCEHTLAAWEISGDGVALSSAEHAEGEGSLSIAGPDGWARFAQPWRLSTGAIELEFFDHGRHSEGAQWLAELRFGLQPLRIILGWDADHYGLEAPQGPSLPVEPIRRRPGWHHLAVQLDGRRLRLTVDGRTLSEGPRPPEPASGLSLLCRTTPTRATPADKAPRSEVTSDVGYIDAVRIVRRLHTGVRSRRQTSQDVVLTTAGDEIFGTIARYTPEQIQFDGAFGSLPLAWDDVLGVYLRRRPPASARVEGLFVRTTFQSAARAEDQPAENRQSVLEGVMAGLDDERLLLEHAWLGRLVIPRSTLESIELLGTGTRVEIDPAAHHLGNEPRPEFQMVMAEGHHLEANFDLERLVPGAAWLAVRVAGIEAEGDAKSKYREQLLAGHLRSNVTVNGATIDYLNHLVEATTDEPHWIRIALPPRLLRVGSNSVIVDQQPDANDPAEFDDCEIVGVRLEIEPAP